MMPAARLVPSTFEYMSSGENADTRSEMPGMLSQPYHVTTSCHIDS